MDKLEPFCRIAGHTSEEVREVLATLEIAYRELFPQLNLRQWSGIIYTWLTQSLLDPTNSDRVSMDNLMKLVTTALEWTYESGLTDVQEETLEEAADLLMLRRDTFRIIDGAGPSVDDQDTALESPAQAELADANKESQGQIEFETSSDPIEKIHVPYVNTRYEPGSKISVIYNPQNTHHHFRIAKSLRGEEIACWCFLILFWIPVTIFLLALLWAA